MSTTIIKKVRSRLRRIKYFIVDRLVTVALLWACIGVGSMVVPEALSFITSGRHAQTSIPLEPFADKRLIWLLLLGLWVLYALFGGLKRFIPWGSKEQANEASFFIKVWDEISSACTHLVCALVTMHFCGQLNTTPETLSLYLLLALVTFKVPSDNSMPSPDAQVSATS